MTEQTVYDQFNTRVSEIDQARTVGPLAAHLGAIAADLPRSCETLILRRVPNEPPAAIDRLTDSAESRRR